MAIAITAELPGGTAEFDEEMTRRLNLGDNPPAGALVRIAGPIEGGWKVMSVWESQEAWDKFRTERLEPAFREADRQMPQFQIWQLHSARVNR